MRVTRKLVRRLLLVGLLLLSMPYLFLIGFGIYRGHDVLAGLSGLWGRPHGTTIERSRVPYGPPRPVLWLGRIGNPKLYEASGLAVSRRSSGVLWSHNDSGNANELFALSPDGRDLGRVPIDAPRRGDWEDMAAFELDGKHYLVIGDIGDNYAWRRKLFLLVVEEPPVPGPGEVGPNVPIAWSVEFRFPEYRDCEALAVDADSDSVLLVSKRVIPAEVFRVPLRPAGGSAVVAERIALLTTIPQPDDDDVRLNSDLWEANAQPTALDIAGNLAVVVTYRDAYLYRRLGGEGWAPAFERIPERIALPAVFGREAAALTPDGRLLYVTSEREETAPAPIFRVELGENENGSESEAAQAGENGDAGVPGPPEQSGRVERDAGVGP